MTWISLSERAPTHKQVCMVKTTVQLDLFYDPDTCIGMSIYLAEYNADRDCFYETKTRKKIKNPRFWSPI